jgi:replicative DNA helicase
MSQNIKNKLQELINQDIEDFDFAKKLKRLAYEQDNIDLRINESSTFGELFQDAVKSMDSSNNIISVYPTHFTEIDRAIGGFSPGEFIVIGGRPAMGKTQFLVNLALNFAREYAVLYFSFDLTKETIAKRFISCMTHIPISNLMQQDLNVEMEHKISDASTKINQYQLFLNDSCHNSTDALRAMCKKHIEENNVKFIFVDYLQLMSSRRFSRNREIEISQISRELKMLANDYNICVIASSQLSRSVETRGGDKRPVLSDLRESGAIEQDADKVLFIYRPAYYGLTHDENGEATENRVEIIVAKNRNGALDNARLMKDTYTTHFSDFHLASQEFIFAIDRLKELDNLHTNKEDEPF